MARDPEAVVGLIQEAGTDAGVDYRDLAQVWTDEDNVVRFAPARVLRYDGVDFEHCAEDGDGVWLYRRTPQ